MADAEQGNTLDLSAVGDIATNGSLVTQAVARLVVLMQRFPNIVLPIVNGGTGANTAAQAIINLFGGAFPGGVVPVTSGGTGAANASDARTNLGVAIGVNVQAYDAQLSSLVRQNSQSADYTLVAGDSGYQIYHPASDTNNRTWTIPANASVAFAIGTAVTFVNRVNTITIAITSDTLILMGGGSTGSRTLAANGIATALKTGTTEWVISGIGLT